MTDWFVAHAGQQQGPMPPAVLRGLITDGTLPPDALVWRQGMPEWLPAGDVAELRDAAAPPAPPPPADPPPAVPSTLPALTERGLNLLRATAPWARVIGVVCLLIAALGVLTTAGLLMALAAHAANGGRSAGLGGVFAVISLVYGGLSLLYVVPGVYLNRFANRINAFVRDRRGETLEQALAAQKSLWKFLGILAIATVFVGFVLPLSITAIATMTSSSTLTNTTITPTPANVPVRVDPPADSRPPTPAVDRRDWRYTPPTLPTQPSFRYTPPVIPSTAPSDP